VTVAPGEAFLGGWLCRDTSTTLTLPPNATTDIVIGHATDAIFDPAVDPDRDAADEVIVDLAGSVASDIPQVITHRVETDGSGVTSASRIATVGGFSEVDAGTVDASEAVGLPVFPTESDIPSGLAEGTLVFISDEQRTIQVGTAGPGAVGAEFALAADFIF
jgi:hypothetical protein